MEDSEEGFFAAEMVVHLIIEDLIDSGSQSLYNNYIEENSFAFSVASTAAVLSSTLEVYFFRHDAGEPDFWPESAEVPQSGVDTWVRKAVPVKKVPAMRKIENAPTATLPDAKSVASHSSRRSVIQRFGRSTKGKGFRESEVIEETSVPVPIPLNLTEINEQ